MNSPFDEYKEVHKYLVDNQNKSHLRNVLLSENIEGNREFLLISEKKDRKSVIDGKVS